MPDAPPAALPPAAAAAPRRRAWRWGLRTTILLVGVAAVAISVVKDWRRIAELKPKVATLRTLGRELVVDDPARPAAVQLEATWSDKGWDVHIPARGQYRLALATRAIGDELPPPGRSAALAAGRHRVVLERAKRDGGWQVTARVDGEPLLVVEEPAGWRVAGGSTGKGTISVPEQAPPGRPLVLAHDRFFLPGPDGSSREPQGPGPGIALWIENVP